MLQKSYEVTANWASFGIYIAESEYFACELVALDAGYKSIEDMCEQLECSNELKAHEINQGE